MPAKNKQFVFYISLAQQSDPKVFQTNPTLAIGDVKVSTGGGSKDNIGTLPVVTPTGSDQVKVTLSAAEMNHNEGATVTFADATGDEWCSRTIHIPASRHHIIVGAGDVGNYDKNDVVYLEFQTLDADGVPVTLGGTPDISVWKDNNTAQTTNGVTLSVDHDSQTGTHVVAIDTSDVFYANGSNYKVRISTGTILGESVVGRIVGSFALRS